MENGIDVWDCVTTEDALVIPWVHAFQGDNPMASEFATHIGMAGKCVCRICNVYRVVDEEHREHVSETSGAHREGEGMTTEAARIHAFMKVGFLNTYS